MGELGGCRDEERKRPCLFIHGCTTVFQAQRGQGFVLIPQNRDSRSDKSDLLLVGDLNFLCIVYLAAGSLLWKPGEKDQPTVYENDLFASFFFLRGKLDTQNKMHALAALSVHQFPESFSPNWASLGRDRRKSSCRISGSPGKTPKLPLSDLFKKIYINADIGLRQANLPLGGKPFCRKWFLGPFTEKRRFCYDTTPHRENRATCCLLFYKIHMNESSEPDGSLCKHPREPQV